ncbi:endolytic transglycosylase MltG [Sulfurimonas xiamenensis]
MNNKILISIKWIFKIVLIIILSFMYYLNKPINSPQIIYIPKGSINKIIAHLQSRNYNINKLDALLLRVIGSPQSGWIDIGTTCSTRGDFLYKLTTAKAALQNVTLIPGETTHIFLDQLADEFHLNRELLQKEYAVQSKYKEGLFVPNTYSLPMGITEEMIIKILLKESFLQMRDFSMKIFGTYNEKKWFHFVTIASIIQKESANIEEMPLVSSVIHNRIKKGMKLQMDGTLNYGKYSHIKVTSKMIKEDKTIYNTYLHSGIPPVPVCNVSFDAIKAAIFPAQTDYLYFVKSKNGAHTFSCNYSTHLTNINDATK